MLNLEGASVLVTGADGFIGSHLAEALVRNGCNVSALAQYNSFGSAGWLDSTSVDVREQMKIHHGDIRDNGFISGIATGMDIVFHLAALIAIPHSYVAPKSYVDTNVVGTLNVLEVARQSKHTRVVIASTSEVYGTPITVPITEDHELNAQSPYAATKVAADQMAKAYAAAFNVDTVILRPFNTYGPRQSMRAVIPTILAQLMSGQKQISLGSLHPVRDFTFVDDTVKGFILAAQSKIPAGDTIQLGTGQAISVGDLVSLCRQVTGSTAQVLSDATRVRPVASEVQCLLADASKAKELMGWEPRVSLYDGLTFTAAWIAQSNHLKSAARYFT